jgi:hypothetical protein
MGKVGLESADDTEEVGKCWNEATTLVVFFAESPDQVNDADDQPK